MQYSGIKKKGEKTSFQWRIKEVIAIGNILIVLKRIQLTKSNSLAKAFCSNSRFLNKLLSGFFPILKRNILWGNLIDNP